MVRKWKKIGVFMVGYGPRLLFLSKKIEKYDKKDPQKVRTNKATKFRRVQERSELLVMKKVRESV